jgi:hypothetical protein
MGVVAMIAVLGSNKPNPAMCNSMLSVGFHRHSPLPCYPEHNHDHVHTSRSNTPGRTIAITQPIWPAVVLNLSTDASRIADASAGSAHTAKGVFQNEGCCRWNRCAVAFAISAGSLSCPFES